LHGRPFHRPRVRAAHQDRRAGRRLRRAARGAARPRVNVRVLIPGYPDVLGACAGKELARISLLGPRRPSPWRKPARERCAAARGRLPGALRAARRPLPGRRRARTGRTTPCASASSRSWRRCSAAPARRCAGGPRSCTATTGRGALAPVYLEPRGRAARGQPPDHPHLAFQGNFEPGALPGLRLPEVLYRVDDLEFYGRLSFLKGGIVHADALSTVSPTYAREIQAHEQGCGMEGLAAPPRRGLTGILNGIDTVVWIRRATRTSRSATTRARSTPRSATRKHCSASWGWRPIRTCRSSAWSGA